MGSTSPHVVQVGFHADPRGREPRELLQAWPTLVDVAEAAHQGGMQVSVVQASRSADVLDRNGVRYHFLAQDANAPLLIQGLGPEVIHVHGL